MKPRAGIRRLFRLRTTGTVGRDVEEEIAFHLDSRVEQLMQRGHSRDEALRLARQRFGDVGEARSQLEALSRRKLRQERRADWFDAMRHDVRYALRGMGRNGGFTAAVVLTLALGIGVNAAMFGITDHLLLRAPAHVVEPDQVVRPMAQNTPEWTGELTLSSFVSYAEYLDIRESGAFAAVAAYTGPRQQVLGRGETAREVRMAETTASYFPLLGVQPALGRFFTEEEDGEPRGDRVVVLSHAFWERGFGGDRSIAGQTIELDHTTYTVVGVAPKGFRGIDLAPVDGWVLTSAVRPDSWPFEEWYTSRNMIWLRLVARLAPGTSAAAVQEQAAAAWRAGQGERYENDPTANLVLGSVIAARSPAPSGQGAVQRSGQIALWLLGVSGVVLIISCLNVANLLLARSLRRRREIGVRMAMGVSRLRLGAQVLTETIAFAAAGAALGLLIAHWGGQLARSMLLPDVEWLGSPVDRRMVLFAGAATFASALVAGLLPALHAARSDVAGLLTLGGRGASTRRSTARSGLVALQAALSILLLVGAGLFVRSLHEAKAVPLGFEPEAVMGFNWHDAGLGWPRERQAELAQRALERVQQLPQVEAAALSSAVPFWSMISSGIRVPGVDSVPSAFHSEVTPDYFRVMGSRILRGRGFNEGDGRGAPPVIVVTASLAQRIWPHEDAIGKCIVRVTGPDADDPCREIVGIVEDTRIARIESEQPTHMFFLPRAQTGAGGGAELLVRGRSDAASVGEAVRAAMRGIEPDLPYVRSIRLQERIDPQLQPWRLGAALFTAFGVLALLLAAIGLYGVISYDVAQRTREIGVRLALGARSRNVLGAVVGWAIRIAGAGIVIGLAAAGFLVPRVEALLFRVPARDPFVLVGAALLVVTVALAAAALPARRAMRVQPNEALRGE